MSHGKAVYLLGAGFLLGTVVSLGVAYVLLDDSEDARNCEDYHAFMDAVTASLALNETERMMQLLVNNDWLSDLHEKCLGSIDTRFKDNEMQPD